MYAGLSVGSSYLGTGVTGPDDRSMVHEVNAAGEESCLFITQVRKLQILT